jgi:hypothetical protein
MRNAVIAKAWTTAAAANTHVACVGESVRSAPNAAGAKA